MKFAVVRFPGSNCDQDAYHVLKDVVGVAVDYVWHEEKSVKGYDCIVLPGGFSYGDYLRTGAIARFSPIMDAVIAHAERGRFVMGICNGFQVLCEAHLLPGALVRNSRPKFSCKWVGCRIETTGTPWTQAARLGQVLRIPIAHGEGRYVADEATLDQLEAEDRVVLRYAGPGGTIDDQFNPNGSMRGIAGILNSGRNILGMMPHPERAAEKALGSADGKLLFDGMVRTLRAA